MEYRHGAYGELGASILRQPELGEIVPVYVGTAPVHLAMGGTGRVNEPVLVRTMNEARRLLGYSDDWSAYTLCEAMHAHFAAPARPVAPLVLINVLNPLDFQGAEEKTVVGVALTRAGALLPKMGNAVLDTLAVEGKELGVDYSVEYLQDTGEVRIRALTAAMVGQTVDVTYHELGTVTMTPAMVAGAASDLGKSTGVYAIDKVYQATGVVPYVLAAPGWSQIVAVHDAMEKASRQISGHWYAWCVTDLPLEDGAEELALDSAAAWQQANGYTYEGERVNWPMAGWGDKVYHLSTLKIVAQMRLDMDNGNIPYESVDNKALTMDRIVLAGGKTALYGPESLNKYLLASGVSTAVFWGGQWVAWGPHTAAYKAEEEGEMDPRAIYGANMRMLYYLINRFQLLYGEEVGRPYTRNRAQSIEASFQSYLDGLRSVGALVKGECAFTRPDDGLQDVMAGEMLFNIAVTNTPPLRSVRAVVRFDETGLELIFAEEE